MEIVLPLLALGGMYVISSRRTAPKPESANTHHAAPLITENYENMGRPVNTLPNTNIPAQNYPVPNYQDIGDTVQHYPNPNVATDKYFNQNLYEQMERSGAAVGDSPPEIYSLTGNFMQSQEFTHNNMTPFNGGKVRGNTYHAQIAESVLDNMIGTGTQTVKKVEQAPLFKPEENVQWAYGNPNQSDFFQSRMNPSMRSHNIKPFETVRVGPGLNQGYGTEGTGGFNSGMEARDQWLPRTVDELRVDTNPKLTYTLDGLEGPADGFNKTYGTVETQGRVEKNRPDTFFINSQDRWLTTTGASKGETLRSAQEMGILRRPYEASDYMGTAGTVQANASYAPENYEASRRLEPCAGAMNHPRLVGQGGFEDGEHFLSSHTNYANHRSSTSQPDTIRSGFSAAVGAVIAPVMDIFRPTRKAETIENVRIYGEGGTSLSPGYVYNPQQATPTTIKETTVHSNPFYINNQRGEYVNNYTAPNATQRQSTEQCLYYSAPGGQATTYGNMSYEAAYNQRNNDIKSQTILNRMNQGGTQIFNQNMNVHLRNDCDRFGGRMNPAFSAMSAVPPSTELVGAMRSKQQYDNNMNCERLDGNLLAAFRQNPYTQSLTSVR